MTSASRRVLLGSALFLLASLSAYSQVATGTPAFGSFSGGPDVVNLGNLNDFWSIPIINKAGRGQNFVYNLVYNSSIWYPVAAGSGSAWEPVTTWGWQGLSGQGSAYASYDVQTSQGTCGQYNQYSWQSWTFANFEYVDQYGVIHHFYGGGDYINSPSGSDECPPNGAQPSGPQTYPATDNSGLSITITINQGFVTLSIFSPKTSTGGGTYINVPIITNPTGSQGEYSSTDSNGNEINSNGSDGFIDTLGDTALTITGVSPNPTDLTYTNPSNQSSSYVVSYKEYNIQTDFNCAGVTEYSQPNVYLVDRITLPDSRYYQFTYEPTPNNPSDVTGRIASVTLPTGGTITYSYTSNLTGGQSNGIVCADGSTSGMTRATPDGNWTYTRSGSGSQWTTTVTAPTYQGAANQTVLGFLTDENSNFYEISKNIYSGSASPGNLLRTVLTCYSQNCSDTKGDNATSVSDPVEWRQTTVQMPGANVESYGHLEEYDAYGDLTKRVDYGFNSGLTFGSALRQTQIVYTTLADGIIAPSNVAVEDGTGQTSYSSTSYTYDQVGVTSTSGTPQHESGVNGGNITQVTQLVSATSSLTSRYTYFDTGNVKTFLDVNGALTSYAYGDCGNSFPTQVSYPVDSLTTQATWNCTGAVQATSVDANGNTTTYHYQDPNYWRITSTQDWLGNVTTQSYQTTSSNTSESAMLFNNNNSTSDQLMDYDQLGRQQLNQIRQGPGLTTFDTTEETYDAMGRMSGVSIPYSATEGGRQATFTGTSYLYDPLNRIASISDSGGGYTNYTWTQYDELMAQGPAAPGENIKQRQYEYDALGRLASVCEMTTALPGYGTCGQLSQQKGYWTEYTYDPASRLLEVQQNAQSSTQLQTRSFTYDMLGRIISQSIPESGTTTYTYDSASACPSPNSFPGDLVMTRDQMGNVTCNQYDGLHRLTSSTVISGPYSSSTPPATYIYDAATTGEGIVMQNVKGALAKACTGSCSSPTTLDFFSYYPASGVTGGLTAEEYERMANSGSVPYFVQESYYPNGAVAAISATFNGDSVPGMPSETYNVDGEGRPLSASDGSHNLVTTVSYNSAEMPTAVTIGDQSTGSNSDFDYFQYDPETDRPTQFQYAVNPSSNPFTITGNLTWNANWSLKQLSFTDTNDSSKSQTCSYSADDLQRVASVDCQNTSGANVEQQTFSADAFGNVSKTGNPGVTWAATYNYATNQINNGLETYDTNGDVTSSGFTWNAWGEPITVSGVSASYDALGRTAETGSGGTYTDFIYLPSGEKLALLHETTLDKAVLPLPGGGTAVYNASGLNYIRHKDWLGSSRLATSWTHGIYAKEAYAPYGEAYNETGTLDRSFTGEDQDTAETYYDFPYRRYYAISSRWMSPDPYNGSYDLTNPQSFNRYAYVLNSPLVLFDPTGLAQIPCPPNSIALICVSIAVPGNPGGSGGGAVANPGQLLDSGTNVGGGGPAPNNGPTNNPKPTVDSCAAQARQSANSQISAAPGPLNYLTAFVSGIWAAGSGGLSQAPGALLAKFAGGFSTSLSIQSAVRVTMWGNLYTTNFQSCMGEPSTYLPGVTY